MKNIEPPVTYIPKIIGILTILCAIYGLIDPAISLIALGILTGVHRLLVE